MLIMKKDQAQNMLIEIKIRNKLQESE